MTNRRAVLAAVVVSVLGSAVAAAPAQALTHARAMVVAKNDAAKNFTGAVMGQFFWTNHCYGPYSNRARETQWKCYGNGADLIHLTWWHINLDPYGRVLYIKGCFTKGGC